MSISTGLKAALAVYTLSAAAALAANVSTPDLQPAQPPQAAPAADRTAPIVASEPVWAGEATRTHRPVTVEEISAAELAAVGPGLPQRDIEPGTPSRRQVVPDGRMLEPFDFRADFARDAAPTSSRLVHTVVPTATIEPSLGAVEHEPVLPILLPAGMVLVGLIALVALLLRPARRESDPYFGG